MAKFRITIGSDEDETVSVLNFESDWRIREGLAEWLRHEIDGAVTEETEPGYITRDIAITQAQVLIADLRAYQSDPDSEPFSIAFWAGRALSVLETIVCLSGEDYPHNPANEPKCPEAGIKCVCWDLAHNG